MDRILAAGDPPDRPGRRLVVFSLVTGAAFALYWGSSFILEVRNATTHFGADSHLYAPLAAGNVIDRVARFHPLTVAMSITWMKAFGALTPWISPHHLLKALFALVGAIGVWAAMAAASAVVARRYVVLCGIIYAASFGVWYFASIEESKIVTASLSALYIAVYLQLRQRWSRRGAVALTVILLLACLNEIVSCFLVIIPFVDTLMQRGWDWRHGWWIAVHGLAAPVALFVLEGVVNGWWIAKTSDAEGASHFSMLLFYLLENEHSLASLYSFALNWLLFNIAAPTPDAMLFASAGTKGYFEPALLSYFSSPVSAGVLVLLGGLTVAGALPQYRAERFGNLAGIMLALAAYACFRGLFFFMFNPAEPLLFSPAVSLAHLLVIVIAFAHSRAPGKPVFLAAWALLLIVNNGIFIIGR